MSKPWSESTKRWVVIGLVVASSVLLYRVRSLLPPVILAALLAYLLNPAVERVSRLRMSRTSATLITYLIVLLVVGLAAQTCGLSHTLVAPIGPTPWTLISTTMCTSAGGTRDGWLRSSSSMVSQWILTAWSL